MGSGKIQPHKPVFPSFGRPSDLVNCIAFICSQKIEVFIVPPDSTFQYLFIRFSVSFCHHLQVFRYGLFASDKIQPIPKSKVSLLWYHNRNCCQDGSNMVHHYIFLHRKGIAGIIVCSPKLITENSFRQGFPVYTSI